MPASLARLQNASNIGSNGLRRPSAVTGAAGAVGGYAIERAKTDGLTVLAAASQSDEALVRGLGADIIVERGDDIGARIRSRLSSGAPGLIDCATLDGPGRVSVAS